MTRGPRPAKGLRLSAIAGEAIRNLAAGVSRATAFALALFAVGAGLSLAEVAEVQGIIGSAHEYQSAGASILTLTAPGAIDGDACDALSAVPGVRAAGAIRVSADDLAVAALPRGPIPAFEVSGGLVALFEAGSGAGARPGVYLSHDAAETLGVGTGDRLDLSTGIAFVEGIYEYPDDGRRPGYRYAALVPKPATAPFDECWLDAWPQSQQYESLLRTAALPAGGDDPQNAPALSQLNTRLGAEFGGRRAFDERISRFAPAAAALGAFVLGYLFVRIRRLELASAMHSGVAKSALLTIVLIECAAWIVASMLLASPVLVWQVSAADATDIAALALLAVRAPLSAAAAAVAGAVTAVGLTRERHLFAYFKNR